MWLAGAGSGAFASVPRASVDPRVGNQAAMRVLRVEATSAQGRTQVGSGVIVAPDRVATSCHVIREAQDITVVKGGLRHTVSGQASDVHHDLCVLAVANLGLEPVTLASPETLQRGDPLLAIGYTGGAELRFSVGSMRTLYRMEGSSVIVSSNAFNSGASGGGLFDADGRLRGLLTFRLRGQEAAYYSVPVDWLAPLLAPGQPYQPVGPQSGQAFWEDQGSGQQATFLRADGLRRERRWTALIDLARGWARTDPDDPQALQAWSDGLQGLGRYDDAASMLARLLRLDPRDALAWSQRGALLLRLGRRSEVRDIVVRLRALDDDLADQLSKQLETR